MSYAVPQAGGGTPDDLSLLGTSYNEYIENHGQWVVYVRGDRRFPCPDCFDPSTESVDEDTHCPECMGLGYKATLERMKVHVALDVKKTYATKSGMAAAYYGDVESSAGLLYSRAGSYPQYQDLVIETEWDVPYERVSAEGTPTRLLTTWRIMRPNAVINGPEGAVDLWLSGLQRHNIKGSFYEQQIRGAGARILPPGGIEGLTSGQSRLYGGVTLRDSPVLGNQVRQRDLPGGRF